MRGRRQKLKLAKAEVALMALTAAVCVFLLGFYAGRSGTQGQLTVTSSGLSAPVSAALPEQSAQERADEDTTTGLPAAEPVPIDLNRADAAQLQTLPGIGEVLAGRILAYREEHGAFRLTEELMDVRGIGETIFAQIKDYITVEESNENSDR